MSLLRGTALVDDAYVAVADDAELPAQGALLLGFERWLAERESLVGRELGVRLPNTLDVTPHGAELARLPLIACEFPSFPDGRAYSQARLLRDRFGFKGELRAIGEAVVHDQLHSLMRCGFDGFALRADQNVDECIRALQDFSLAYQPAADAGVVPVLQRRRAAAR